MIGISSGLLLTCCGVILQAAFGLPTCLQMSGSGGGIELFSRNHTLQFGDGTEFKLKGLNWFGFETGLYVVHGLWERSIEDFLNFITQHKFNALRIPLSVDGVMDNPNPPSYDYESCYFDGTITSLEALDYLIDRLAERGILVLLDQHRLNTGSNRLVTLTQNMTKTL